MGFFLTRCYWCASILLLYRWGGGGSIYMNYSAWSRLYDMDPEKVEDLMLIEKETNQLEREAISEALEDEYYLGETVLRIVTTLSSSKVSKYLDLYKNLDRQTIWSYLAPKGHNKNIEIFKDTRKKGVYYFVDTKYIGTIADKGNNGVSLIKEVVNWEIRDANLALSGEVTTQRAVVAKSFIISFKNIENITIDQIFDECQN